MNPRQWSYGDKVVHTKRPEWGTGTVAAAQTVTQDGTVCQRLTVRFDRAGLKTLTTSMAELRPATDADNARPDPQHAEPDESSDAPGWLGKLAADPIDQQLIRLPESTRDPFTTLAERFKATLALYRFNESGGSLLDWAASQTTLSDPLSRFSRHELELLFRRFAFNRDEHLKKLALELKRADPAALTPLVRAAPSPAQQVLRRIDIAR